MAILICALGAGAYLVLLAIKTICAMIYVRRYPAPADRDLSGATIVQAILSGDPGLVRTLLWNLDTFPEARFVWLIDAEDAEADAATARLQDQHPVHRIERIICGPAPAGVNPKLFKLEQARTRVTAGTFVVLDDDTMLTRESLAALVDGASTSTLSTGLPCYVDGHGLLSHLVVQFVNNNAALTYLPIPLFTAPRTINGMAYAIAPSNLEALGGFTPIWRQLADDLALARRVLDRSGTIAQTPYPQFITTTVRHWRHYRALMHRWFLFALLLLDAQSAVWRTLIGVLYGLAPVLLWVAAVAGVTSVASAGWVGPAMVAALLVLRGVTLVYVQRATTGKSHHAPFLSIAAELLQPLHLLDAVLHRTIRWRTRTYVVRANDDFRSV
jgi:ceramide glucosyltransferase